jgi:hypothetical protein
MIKKQKLFFNRDRNIQVKILKAKRQEKIISLAKQYQADGMSVKKVHLKLKEQGYKIGYSRLFYLIKESTIISILD